MSREIVIAGGGLAGSLMAVYLARRSYQVTVLEKRPDMRRENVSAGRSINLALANRGIAGLDGAGVMDRVRPLLTEMRGRMLHDERGGLDFQAYGNKPNEVIHSVSRGDLNRRLMDAAEETGRVDFRFGQRVEDVDFRNRRITVIDEGSGARR
jgi:kynurenine 3-monooxygenase